MAATFIKKLVMIITKNAMPIIKKKPLELWNIISHFIASHLAAPVCQRQKPMLMAPAKSRMIFHGISSRSSISRMPVIKKRIVDVKIMAVLSRIFNSRKKGTQRHCQNTGKDDDHGDYFFSGNRSQLFIELNGPFS